MSIKSLSLIDEASLQKGLRFISRRDQDLARVLGEFGPPPIWAREPGFATLIHIILEQQVSLASARAAFDRLATRVSPLMPSAFLELDDVTLKTIGFSRQKTAYCRHLAEAISSGTLNLDEFHHLDDHSARAELLKLKGIGAWTADIYLLMVLRRPDIWPVGDLALALAIQKLKGLSSRPGPEQLEELSLRWRPWRAVAARLLWHYYLSTRAAKNGS
jgi:DNA-3-methyladenine glycosylase II